jgi:hypothetical protein
MLSKIVTLIFLATGVIAGPIDTTVDKRDAQIVKRDEGIHLVECGDLRYIAVVVRLQMTSEAQILWLIMLYSTVPMITTATSLLTLAMCAIFRHQQPVRGTGAR